MTKPVKLYVNVYCAQCKIRPEGYTKMICMICSFQTHHWVLACEDLIRAWFRNLRIRSLSDLCTNGTIRDILCLPRNPGHLATFSISFLK